MWLLKLFTSFNFFSNLCSRSICSSGAEGYNLSHFCSLYIVKITPIQLRILNIITKIISYSYTSMYTKNNYIYNSMIEILYSYMSVYINLPR